MQHTTEELSREDTLKVELHDIRSDLERQAREKGFDHQKTSLWKLTGAMLRYIGHATE